MLSFLWNNCSLTSLFFLAVAVIVLWKCLKIWLFVNRNPYARAAKNAAFKQIFKRR